MSRRLTWRQEVARAVSYARYLGDDSGDRCEAYKRMSARARANPDLREGHRCTNAARWRYFYMIDRVTRTRRKPKELCWAHLMSQGFYYSMTEDERFQRWCRRHGPEIAEIKKRHGVRPGPGTA